MTVSRTARLLAGVALAVGGCVDGPGEPSIGGEPGPGAFEPSYATSDAFFTRMAGPVEGESVHGTVQIWYSTNLEPLLGAPFVAPEGTVAIKAQDNGQPALTVMIKEAAGFDPENGDWSYEQRSADGALTNAGALPACIACHAGWPETDHLAGTELE